MPDEHDHEPGPEGPRRPTNTRQRTIRTESPGIGGNTIQNQRVQTELPAPGAEHATPRDARFANAPLSGAERKALYEARNLDDACAVLGRYQEERMKDGRLPPADNSLVPEINRRMTVDAQIARGMRPTAEDIAYIGSASDAAERQDRANEFLEARKQTNEQLFRQSRRWGAEMDRQARPDEPNPADDRQWGPHGVQGWRARITDAAYRANAHRTATQGRPPSLDPRFEDAPITPPEIKALKEAKTPEAAAELLSRFQEDRMNDARLPEPSRADLEKALIGQVLTSDELARTGLAPTARDLACFQAAAADGRELECTLEFIADRQAQNTRWHLDAQYAAHQQERLAHDKASSFWYERAFPSPSAERDARTEKAERRTDVQARREQTEQRREGGPRDDPGNEGRDGNEGGGRGR